MPTRSCANCEMAKTRMVRVSYLRDPNGGPPSASHQSATECNVARSYASLSRLGGERGRYPAAPDSEQLFNANMAQMLLRNIGAGGDIRPRPALPFAESLGIELLQHYASF